MLRSSGEGDVKIKNCFSHRAPREEWSQWFTGGRVGRWVRGRERPVGEKFSKKVNHLINSWLINTINYFGDNRPASDDFDLINFQSVPSNCQEKELGVDGNDKKWYQYNCNHIVESIMHSSSP